MPQASTTTLSDAVVSPVQEPVAAVRVSWDGTGSFVGAYDTLTGYGDVSINRAIKGPLPEAVSVISGESSAAASVSLVNSETLADSQDAAWFYSRLNASSPLAVYERLSNPVQIEFGYKTAAGIETLRKITGVTTDLDVNVSSGTASLDVIDYRDKLSGEVNLPAVVNDEFDNLRLPGLDSQWLIDYVMRQNGYFVSPPALDDATTAVLVTFHGSAHPEVGVLREAWTSIDGVARDMLEFNRDGKFAESLKAGPTTRLAANKGPNIWVYTAQDILVTTGSSMHAHLWAKVGSSSNGIFTWATHPTSSHYIQFVIESGVIRVYTKRTPSSTVQSFSATVLGNATPAWTYVGFELVWTASGATVRIRINATTSSGTITQSYSGVVPPFTAMGMLPDFPVESWEVSNIAANVWSNTFTSQVQLDSSINKLTAVVDTTAADSWALLKELATAELGCIFFDELGVFHFWSRDHWVTTEAQTVQRTLDVTDQIKTIGYSDGIAQIANIVTAPVTSYSLGAGTDSMWVSPDSFTAIAGYTSKIFDVDLGKAATDIKIDFSPVQDTTRSWFEARVAREGGDIDNSNVSVVAEVISAQKVRITIINRHSQFRYLITSDGKPSIHLWGRPIEVISGSDTGFTKRNQLSIDIFGERSLTLPNSKWLQNGSSALGIASAVLSETANPNPVLTSVTIPGDPRIQLGDRHQINGGTSGITGEYRVLSIQDKFGDSGYTQTLEYGRTYKIGIWGQSLWGRAVWGEGP